MRRHILSIGIVLCLALALQAPARAAVQMRLPSLKKYYLDTVLVSNGAAASAIVAPDAPGYADLAGDVRRAIKDLTGAELPVITDAAADAELAQAGGGRRAMIVLGNISVNKVSERLYVMEQVDVDAGWPGAGGYLLQTVHDPMGDGRNFISLGGSDLKGVQAATQAFIGLLKADGKSLKVGRLFKLEGTYKGPAPLTVAHVNRKGYGSPNAAVSHAGECAHILRRYRTPGYGRMFRHAMERIAATTEMTEAQLYGVATFYSQFRLAPVGQKIIKVCHGTACHVGGAEGLTEALEARLGIKDGETTADMKYTLESVACLGCCSLAPVVMVGDKAFGKLDRKKAVHIIDDLESGGESR